jgi:hypothetical protein
MALREVVDAAPKAPDRAPCHQAVQGDVDGGPGPKAEKLVGNENGSCAAPLERGGDAGVDRARRAGRHL